MADAVGTLGLTYDERGNELSETRSSGAVTLTTAYGYDAVSRIASIGYPSGDMATLPGHDAAGQVTAIRVKLAGSGSTVPVVSGVSYAPFGPVIGMTYGNGIVEARSYDGDYRLATLATGSVQALTYGYDAADNVKAITDGVTPPNSQSFGYDVLDHLAAATGVYSSLAWTYDHVGNRLTATAGGASGATYGYLSKSNRLTRISASGVVQSFGYNGAGNLAAITQSGSAATSLTYNQSERLAGVTIGGNVTASYSYDAFGRRFMKTLLSSASMFQYDQAGRLLEELDGAGNAKTDTIYLNGLPVGSVVPAAGAVLYIHTDRLGTPQLATSATQSLVWGATYEPFGGLDGQPSGSLTQNLRFPGQYADAETGWYQNGFRDYAPLWGRYLESDPIGLAGGVNTYGYVEENPGASTDFDGLVNQNWFSPVTNPNFYYSGQNYTSRGTYTILGHGDPGHFCGGGLCGTSGAQDISADQLARLIYNDPNYSPGMPVQLIACQTGVS